MSVLKYTKPPYGYKPSSPVPSYGKPPSPDRPMDSNRPLQYRPMANRPMDTNRPLQYRPTANRPLHIALPLFQTVLSSTVLWQTALSIPPHGYKPSSRVSPYDSKSYSILKAPSLRPLCNPKGRLTLSALFGTNYAPAKIL